MKQELAALQRELDRRDAATLDALSDRDADEYLDSSSLERLLAGACPVTIWRERRRLSLERLAAIAGLDPRHVAALEAGESVGTVADLARLAHALDVQVDDLIPADLA